MMAIIGLILIILGIVAIINPKLSWYLSWGWRFKDVEPSEAALIAARLSGVIFVLFGLFLIFNV